MLIEAGQYNPAHALLMLAVLTLCQYFGSTIYFNRPRGLHDVFFSCYSTKCTRNIACFFVFFKDV